MPPPPPPLPRFRQMCQSIIAHKLFDYVVLAFIFSNCITVALERPKILQGSLVNRTQRAALHLLPGGDHPDMKPFIFTLNCIMSSSSPPSLPAPVLSVQERVFLTISNYIFTAIFVGEMTLKVTFYSMSPCFIIIFFNITASNSLMAVVHTLARACPPHSHVLFPSLLSWQSPCFFEQLGPVIN